MARKDELHLDRGDGVCQICYEEMPCGVLAGDVRRPRIDDDELHAQLEASKAEEEARKRIADLLTERLGQLGLDIVIPYYARSVTVRIEHLAALVALIPIESKGVGNGEVQTPELAEGDEDLSRLWPE